MHGRLKALALLTGAAVTAAAQPADLRAPTALPPLATGEPMPPALRLTASELRSIGQRLTSYRARVSAEALSAEELLAAGLDASTDVVESARAPGAKGTETAHVALLEPSTATTGEIDPALEEGARSTLRARLGREPSAPELAAEVAELDARIARMNESLAARRPELRLAMRRGGEFPRAMERPILGLGRNVVEPMAAPVEQRLQLLIAEMLLAQAETPAAATSPRAPDSP